MGASKRHSFSLVAGACLALSALSSPVLAQTAAQDYAALSAQADSIERNNAYLERTTGAQQEQIASLQQQLASLDATAVSVGDLLPRMFSELDQFVANDLPFQSEERSKRIESLREVMASDAPTGEKYRRLLEAYQIELEYGRTMETYLGQLPEKGEVRFVRLGRVTLLYMTPDAAETGYWDMAQKAWVADADYNEGIHNALRMATEEATSDLIIVPIPAASQGR